MITAQSTVVARQNQVFADLEGEAVILNLETGIYHGLNETGCTIWHLVQSPNSVASICDHLVAEYDVEPGQCLAEVLALLGQMVTAGILETCDEQSR